MGIGRKRRHEGGELGWVAEIVMVLAGAGEVRGGRAPTAAECALAAEARRALAAAVAGEVRPRELFRQEAVRSLVQDLGLTRARDPTVVGYRPCKASIASRVVLTKRKMEERKGDFAPSATVPKMTASSAKNGFQHGTSKVTTGSPRNLPTLMISPVTLKQPLLNGTAGASSLNSPSIPSAVSLPPVGPADVKMQIDVNGSNFTQNRGAIAIEQSIKSGHDTTNSSNQSSLLNSSEAEKSVHKKGPVIYPVTGSIVMGYQSPKGELSVQKQYIFNHKAIAKKIQNILHQPANHSSWSVPSTEYMNTRLDCQVCKVSFTNMENLLVCDACESGMHLKCLQYYGNQGQPKTEWYCPTCVVHSKGKALPPKYGKVTRTFVESKICMTSGAQPLQVAAENPTEKDGGSSSKNVAANGSGTTQNANKVGSTMRKSGTLVLDATGSKPPLISGAQPQKEDVEHDGTSSVEKEGNVMPSSGTPTEIATFCNEGQSIGASMYGSGNLSGGSHMHIESNSTSPDNYSKALSGLEHTGHCYFVSSIEDCESSRTSYQYPRKNEQMAGTRTPTDGIYHADRVTNYGVGKPHKHEIVTDDAISDHGDAHQVTLNGPICFENEIIGDRKDGYVDCSTANIVDWVGDGLKSIDNKTYYNSCNIDGITYKLHDHILVSSDGSKSSPCKLQSLWEEHDSGSRLAMVNPYFLGSDIPESISKPCIDEEDEVYGSNIEIIVLVSAILGPCEVLHVDKFRERCQLDSSGCRLHPIFFCRSNYDESTSSLYKDYNVDN